VSLQVAQLTGPQKAAIVVTQMPPEAAGGVLAGMSEMEAARLSRVVATLPEIDEAVVKQVMDEFLGRVDTLTRVRQGGLDVARRLLRERVGGQRAEEEMELLLRSEDRRPFSFLHSTDPTRIAGMLADEHPQLAAVVISQLPADLASKVLGSLDDSQRIDIALRVGHMSKVPADALREVASALSGQSLDIGGPIENEAGGGASALAAILNRSERQVERQVLATMDGTDPELAEEIRRKLFTFEEVLTLDDRALQKVVRVVQPKVLALALKGATEDISGPFLRNMSEEAAADLLEEVEALGQQRRSDVEGAQMDIARKVRELEVEGEIVIVRKGDDVVV